MDLTLEMRGIIYSACSYIVMIGALLVSLLYGKNFGMKKFPSLVIWTANYVIMFIMVSNLWKSIDIVFFGEGSLAAFRGTLFMPFIAIPLAKVYKRRIGEICDFVTPTFFLAHGIVTIGCAFVGCCGGCEMSWGVVSPETGAIVFPLQICVIVFSSIIGILGYWYNRKREYKAGGKTYAWSMILYGALRFTVEFFSDDMRVFSVLSLYSVYSLIMVFVGLVVLYLIDRKSHNAVEDSHNEEINIPARCRDR